MYAAPLSKRLMSALTSSGRRPTARGIGSAQITRESSLDGHKKVRLAATTMEWTHLAAPYLRRRPRSDSAQAHERVATPPARFSHLPPTKITHGRPAPPPARPRSRTARHLATVPPAMLSPFKEDGEAEGVGNGRAVR